MASLFGPLCIVVIVPGNRAQSDNITPHCIHRIDVAHPADVTRALFCVTA